MSLKVANKMTFCFYGLEPDPQLRDYCGTEMKGKLELNATEKYDFVNSRISMSETIVV